MKSLYVQRDLNNYGRSAGDRAQEDAVFSTPIPLNPGFNLKKRHANLSAGKW